MAGKALHDRMLSMKVCLQHPRWTLLQQDVPWTWAQLQMTQPHRLFVTSGAIVRSYAAFRQAMCHRIA